MWGKVTSLFAKGASAAKSAKPTAGWLQMGMFVAGMASGAVDASKRETPAERNRAHAENIISNAIFVSQKSIVSGMLLSAGASLFFNSDAVGRGLVNGVRTGLSHRTSLHVPFSHSNINSQAAGLAYSYAQQKMAGGYSSMGNEAIHFASRFRR